MITPLLISAQKKVRHVEREFLRDVLEGLRHEPKRLPCKYLYDQRGSELFDDICELPEYYPTRTELGIMQKSAREMAKELGENPVLIEFGSGSSLKTRLLLDHIERPATYVPVDISREHLLASADKIADEYPGIDVQSVHADFTQPIPLPEELPEDGQKAVYFPGSTIGNFEPSEARRLLTGIARLVGPEGRLLVGFDREKDRNILEAAYNDAQGVTAEFNLNLLHRINRELNADFRLHGFEHQAIYNEELGRIEMHLISRVNQVVTIGSHRVVFRQGESICTEYSHKYRVEAFAQMADRSGLSLQKTWTDENDFFCLALFEAR